MSYVAVSIHSVRLTLFHTFDDVGSKKVDISKNKTIAILSSSDDAFLAKLEKVTEIAADK